MTPREMEIRIEELEQQLFIARREITRLKLLKERKPNERGAGRKPILTDSEVQQILKLRKEKETIKSLSKKFGVSTGTIHKILSMNSL